MQQGEGAIKGSHAYEYEVAVFWDITRCNLVVSEKLTASIKAPTSDKTAIFARDNFTMLFCFPSITEANFAHFSPHTIVAVHLCPITYNSRQVKKLDKTYWKFPHTGANKQLTFLHRAACRATSSVYGVSGQLATKFRAAGCSGRRADRPSYQAPAS
jgi:hypothetical protein